MSDKNAALSLVAYPDPTKNPDVQKLIFSGYGKYQYAGYCLFQITDRNAFQTWLKNQLDEAAVTPATVTSETLEKDSTLRPMNIAFTATGLKTLLADGWIEESYDPSFVEGMVTDHRSRLLGDVEANDPIQWLWGGKGVSASPPSARSIDGLLIGFGSSKKEIADRLNALNGTNGAEYTHDIIYGNTEAISPRDNTSLKRREPFGFADGISQPVIINTPRYKKLKKNGRGEDRIQGVPAGEFVLGYPDGTDPSWEQFEGTETLPRSPAVPVESDPSNLLNAHSEWADRRDLGRHGSYLVVRQLAQDVNAFWEFLEKAKAPGQTAKNLGSKLVGRSLDGSTLEPDPKSEFKDNNIFDYSNDPVGVHCPLGSHIRRTNPRTFGIADTKEAQNKLKITNRHRILRRGRVYTDDNDVPQGLLFICVNASINRQFEFIQSTWCNNPFFHGLEKEVDPIIGTVKPVRDGACPIHGFTIPREGSYRQVVPDIEQFVTVRGGGYFFLPGLDALRCISQAPKGH